MNNFEDSKNFWKTRAENYNKLNWVHDEEYANEILRLADLRATHIALDVGTGSGTIAKTIKPLVHHVVAMDISGEMMQRGDWEDVLRLNGILASLFFG